MTEREDWFSGPVDGVVFALIMVVAAFLGRENPRFVYPDILFCFLGLLAFNLVNFSVLPRFMGPRQRAAYAVAFNIGLLTLVMRCSGGAASYLWVLYLLPVFSAGLAFSRRGVAAVTAAALLPLLAFHGPELLRRQWSAVLELVVKAAIISASAYVVMRVAGREREARRRLGEERRRGDLERAQARERLQRMDRLATMGTLSAGIAHELKSPLAAILGYTEVAQDAQLPPQETARIFKRIEDCARRCDRTIQDMLALARQKTGARKPCDVNALVSECAALAQYDWLVERIDLERDLAEGLPRLQLSSAEFQQVLFNLLANARQAIRGVRETGGRVRVATRLEGGQVVVAVSDDGPGVPPELADRIWEPFFTTKPEGEGTGLGLAICRRIVMAHGGELSLAPGGPGATFIIRLPASPKSGG